MKKTIIFITISLALLSLSYLSPSPANASALSDAAATMAAREWKQFSTTGFNTSLLDDVGCTAGPFNILNYSDRAMWDTLNNRVYYIGTGHMCGGKIVKYEDSTNTWSVVEQLGGRIGIHSYNHHTMNSATGVFYNRDSGYGNRTFERWNNAGSWTSLAQLPWSSPQVATALEYFPERNSVIGIEYQYREIQEYSISSNSWNLLSSIDSTVGEYHNVAAYSPVHKVVIIGGGNNSTTFYRINSAGVVTKITAPHPAGIWHHSIISVDPLSGDFLFWFAADNSLHSYNPTTNTWANHGSITHPFDLTTEADSPVSSVVAASIPDYNVIMFMAYNAGNPQVWLYRHSSGTSPSPDTQAPTTPTNLTATAVSSGQINLSWTVSTDNVGVTGYRIYRGGTQVATSATNSYSDTGLTASTTYTYTVSAYDAAGNVSNQSVSASTTTQAAPPPSGGLLYDFNTGGPLVCTGTAPNIICDDSGVAKWDSFNYDSSDGRFYHDTQSYLRINWADYDPTHGPDYGWLEVDNTKGAKGSSGSLKARITGSPASGGGQINKKSDELNYPSRVGSGVGGNLYLDFYPGGRHRPEFVSKNRISAYIRIPNNWMLPDAYGWSTDHNLHVGTYVCPQKDEPCIDRTGCSPYSWGEPCDGSNGHFYHYFTFGQWGGGGWVHILLDQTPQFKRWGEDYTTNPTQAMFAEDYIPSLNRFYFDVTNGTAMQVPVPFEMWIDEIEAQSTSDYAEPNQNETTIASVAVGHYPDNDGHWEISWNSGLTAALSTYEVKYSLVEFTNSNFNTNGQHITPLAYAAQGGTGLVGKKRPEDYTFNRYSTYFNLSAGYEQPGTIVYFAIKDVSQAGQHFVAEIGETDTRTSTDTRIHTIDYIIPGQSPSLKGDVNNDSSIDILDIQALVNHILGIQDYGISADVNNDSSVDVLDVQGIVNIILGV